MRLKRYIITEEGNIVDKALKIDEPKEDTILGEEEVNAILTLLDKALGRLNYKASPDTPGEEAENAKYLDIKDKIMKWEKYLSELSNGEEEPPEEDGEEPPEEDGEKPSSEEKEPKEEE